MKMEKCPLFASDDPTRTCLSSYIVSYIFENDIRKTKHHAYVRKFHGCKRAVGGVLDIIMLMYAFFMMTKI